MSVCEPTGRVHSVQSFGTVDGPGVRFVVFMQGCPLRCVCCHNPDTWAFDGGEERTVDELMEPIRRCRRYFGARGGVTVSGGEPLCQAAFVRALFARCHAEGIHTALDTSGCLWSAEAAALLDETDLLLLDYKMIDDADYRRYTRAERAAVERFLAEADARGIETWLRQVSIPGITADARHVQALAAVRDAHACVSRVELLPFRRLCLEKYREMGIAFPLADTPEPTAAEMEALNEYL